MNCDFTTLPHKGIQVLSPYVPGKSIEEVAQEHSQCPSGSNGGDLGKFGPGMMVPEFDKVVFSGDVGVLYGPVQTQFGYHLLEITSRG